MKSFEMDVKLGAWVRCSERMPIPAESPSGYFWCWSETEPEDPPEILEVYGYADYHKTPCAGFCHEACGIVRGVTHWQPAMPPDAPNMRSKVPLDDRRAIFAQRLAEESRGPEQCLWMSFCDTKKPPGQQSLGVIIMLAPGLAHALERAWKLGINPGGQVKCFDVNAADIKAELYDRLLSKEELLAEGLMDNNDE